MKKYTLNMIGLAAFSLLVSFSACKKKSDDAPAPAVVKASTALTSNNFNYSSAKYHIVTNGIATDEYMDIDPCEKIAVYKFTATSADKLSGTQTYTQAGGDCGDGSMIMEWKLNTAQDTLFYSGGAYKIDVDAAGNFTTSQITNQSGGYYIYSRTYTVAKK